jgi:purine-binding chemotaxis protein CheW
METNPYLTANESDCELVAFNVTGQTFAIPVGTVREIRGWSVATPLPHAPTYVLGLVNLRGTMLPILDLAGRLGFTPSVPTDRHAIVVIQVGEQIVGLLVDAVSELITVPCSSIQPPPSIGDFGFKRLVRGVLPHQERMITLLIPESLMTDEQVEELEEAA